MKRVLAAIYRAMPPVLPALLPAMLLIGLIISSPLAGHWYDAAP